MANSTISQNSATDSSGGGIGSVTGTLSIADSVIYGNWAKTNGGGINSSNSTLEVVNTIVSCNFAGDYGGGIKSSSDTIIANSTIAGNSAGGSSGGVSGGSSTVLLENSILALNSAPSASEFFGVLLAGTGFNIIGVDPGFVRNPSDGGDGWGDDPATVDVDESANDDYGDLHLTQHSAAVDMGSDALVPAGVVTDRDGNPRIAHARVDLGAYEFQDPLPAGRETASTVVSTPDDTFNYYDGLISLREALLYVGQDGLGAEVTFDLAMNGQTVALADASIYLDRGVRINASSLDSVTIDAGGHSRVMMLLTPDQVELAGLTITGGSADYGGGIYGCSSDLVITESTISGNTATKNGGGIYLHEAFPGTLEIRGSTITDNTAGQDGGGIYATESVTTIANSIISGNTAGGAGGGASGSGSITNSIISDNVAGGGGGGLFWGGDISDSTISGNSAISGGGIRGGGTIVRCTISGNTAGTGGGMSNISGPTTITDSVFSGNVTTGTRGGAIYNSSSETLSLIGTTIVGNAATGSNSKGGGIYNEAGPSRRMTIANCVILANSSAGDGGGIYNYANSDSGEHNLALTNSTIAGNTSGHYGGGIYASKASMVLQNTIVARNESADYRMDDLYGKLRSTSDYYLVGVWYADYFGALPGTHCQWGTPETPLDPGFVRAPSDGGDGWGDNPATTEVDESANDDLGNLHLRPTSPAVNKGNNARAVDPSNKPLTVDLDGRPRIIYTTVDLGAYEYYLVADVDYSGAVGTADAGILAAHWGLADMSFADGDLNGDARVNAADAAILAANWGATFTPPAEGQSPKYEAVGQAVPDMGPFLLASRVRHSLTYEIRRTSVRHSLTYVPPCSSVVNEKAADAVLAASTYLDGEQCVVPTSRLAPLRKTMARRTTPLRPSPFALLAPSR